MASHRPPAASLDRVEGVRRQIAYWRTVYRRTWKGSFASSFLQPFLYVAALGLLLGSYITDTAALQGAPSYLAFIAPGLIAGQAIQVAAAEGTYPVYGAMKWSNVYYGMIASPLGVGDIVRAHVGFIGVRIATSCLVFTIALAPFGVYASSAGAVGAFGAALLTGVAFATVIYGFAAGTASEQWFSVLFRLGILPLFLFSGAFFPISNLSAPLELLARVTPLWQGVDLARMCSLGQLDLPIALIHIGYLLTMTLLGYRWSLRRLSRKLVV